MDIVKLSDEQLDLMIDDAKENQLALEKFKGFLSELNASKQMFSKTQSQFMDNAMTLSQRTPIRSMHQCAAQLSKAEKAVKYNLFEIKKKQINIAEAEHKLEDESDEFKRQKLELKIARLKSEIEDTRPHFKSIIRMMANYASQYEALKEKAGIAALTEAEFEKAEPVYQIKTAFQQALNAARSRPDKRIDEGNQIFFSQIRINGTAAQMEIDQYFEDEQAYIQQNSKRDSEGRIIAKAVPPFSMQEKFLESMAEKYQESVIHNIKEYGIDLEGSQQFQIGQSHGEEMR